MADLYTFQDSQRQTNITKPLLNKQMLYVIDQQNGSYQGQITFDASSFSNSGRWINYAAGYLEIPYVIAMKSSSDIDVTALVNSFMVGLKSGYYNIVDSISCEFGNTK